MEERIQSSDIDILIEPLYQNVPEFSCGDSDTHKDLNLFFNTEIEKCVSCRFLTAYKVVDINTKDVVAIFTLANDVLSVSSEEDKDDLSEDVRPLIPGESVDVFHRSSTFPAINIGHLGVNKNYQRRGIGDKVIKYVIDTFFNYKLAGCQFIVVDALNLPATNSFYLRLGFSYLTMRDHASVTRRMYYPLFD